MRRLINCIVSMTQQCTRSEERRRRHARKDNARIVACLCRVFDSCRLRPPTGLHTHTRTRTHKRNNKTHSQKESMTKSDLRVTISSSSVDAIAAVVSCRERCGRVFIACDLRDCAVESHRRPTDRPTDDVFGDDLRMS